MAEPRLETDPAIEPRKNRLRRKKRPLPLDASQEKESAPDRSKPRLVKRDRRTPLPPRT